MKQASARLTVKWEQVATPDAEERLGAAFAMLLDAFPPGVLLTDQSLDSQ